MPVPEGDLSAYDRDEVPLTESIPAADGTPPEVLFDERWKEAFHGLAYLGAVSKTFEWFGHKFSIRTLTSDEELAIARIVKDWAGTIGEQRAYIIATVALCTDSVDGKGLPTPIGEEPGIDWAIQRFNFVKGRWYRMTIDKVYEQYMILEAEVRELMEQMGKAFGQGDQTPGLSESSDSSIDEDY